MMIKRILTLFARVAAGAAGTSLALAQVLSASRRSDAIPRDPELSARRLSAPTIRDARRDADPRFRRARRRSAPAARPGYVAICRRPAHAVAGRSALWPPCRRPPVYSDRAAAGSGHVAGRSALWPSRRAAGGDLCRSPRAQPQQTYSDRGRSVRRAPPARGDRSARRSHRLAQPPQGAPMASRWQLSALPPDEQPGSRLRRSCRRTCVGRK